MSFGKQGLGYCKTFQHSPMISRVLSYITVTWLAGVIHHMYKTERVQRVYK